MQRGYPHYLSGIKIIPTQLIESGMALLITLSGISMIWNNHQPGEVLAWYVIAYGTGRFSLEYFRGDERHYLMGLSEAQWTSLVLIALVLLAGDSGLIAVVSWQYSIFAILTTLAILTVLFRLAYPDYYRLFHPRHIRELMGIMKKICRQSKYQEISGLDILLQTKNDLSDVEIYSTSEGLLLSGGSLPSSPAYNVSLSGAMYPVTLSQAKYIFSLIRHLQDNKKNNYEIHENNGVYHMITYPSG